MHTALIKKRRRCDETKRYTRQRWATSESESEQIYSEERATTKSRFTYFPTIWCILMTFFIYFIVSVTCLFFVCSFLRAIIRFIYFFFISLVYSTRNSTNLELFQFYKHELRFGFHHRVDAKRLHIFVCFAEFYLFRWELAHLSHSHTQSERERARLILEAVFE